MTRTNEQVVIIEETSDFLLVYKPAGMPVQSRSLTEMDLEHFLKNQSQERKYLAVINRIDQTVEGLVLFGKTKRAAANLSEQLQADNIQKGYLAVVDGVPAQNEGRLEDELLRDGRTNTSCVVPIGTKEAKHACLSYRCLGSQNGRSLLKIKLYTGRHHQIRVQLSGAGIPIAGDRKYNKNRSLFRFPGLCSCELAFQDPATGKALKYQIAPKGQAFHEFTELIEK